MTRFALMGATDLMLVQILGDESDYGLDDLYVVPWTEELLRQARMLIEVANDNNLFKAVDELPETIFVVTQPLQQLLGEDMYELWLDSHDLGPIEIPREALEPARIYLALLHAGKSGAWISATPKCCDYDVLNLTVL